jgi:hypothetical protein
MPPLAYAPGIVQLVFQQTQAGENIFNVMHLGRDDLTDTDPFTIEEMNSIAADNSANWTDHMTALQSNTLTYQQVIATDLGADDGLQSIFSDPTAGGRTDSPAPSNCAMLIGWHTAVRFRGGHARLYLGGQCSGSTADTRHWTDAEVANALTAADNFGAACPTGYQYVLLRRVSAKAVLHPPKAYPLLATHVDRRVCSQRRRLGRGLV